jgi:hypothetical protein
MQLPRTAIVIAGTALALGISGTAFACTGSASSISGAAPSTTQSSATPLISVCANANADANQSAAVNVPTQPTAATVANGNGSFTSTLNLGGQPLATLHILTDAANQTLSALNVGLNSNAGVQASAASTTPSSAALTVTDAADNATYNVGIGVGDTGAPLISVTPATSNCAATGSTPSTGTGTSGTVGACSGASIGDTSSSAPVSTSTSTDTSVNGGTMTTTVAPSTSPTTQSSPSTQANANANLSLGSLLKGNVKIGSGAKLSLGN